LTAEANIMGFEMTTSPQTTPQDNDARASSTGRRRGIVGRVVAWVVMIAAGLVVLGLVAITIGPRFLPYQALIVRSGSMSPTIPTGSIVFYTKIPSAKVKVGDVIVFTKPGDTTEKVTHRVYHIGHSATGEYFVTKGDANGTPDDWQVPAVGTGWIARFHVPSIGYALVYLQSTLARLLLLVIPAILLGAITLYEIWQDRGRGAATS
jgi:signal peptidase I